MRRKDAKLRPAWMSTKMITDYMNISVITFKVSSKNSSFNELHVAYDT